MNSTVFLQAVINGLSMGSIYALIACGLTLIFGVMNIINMAHGHFLMLAMYVVFFFHTLLVLDPYFSLIISIPLTFLGGLAIFYIFIRPILNYSPVNQILVTLGLGMVMENLALIFFSSDLRNVKSALADSKVVLSSAYIGTNQILAFVGSIAMTFILFQVIQRSSLGRSIRAAAENPHAAILMGINVKRIYLISFALGVTCLGIAAPLLTPLYYISPTVGELFTLTSFVVVVLGGMGNFIGALLGGFIIGMTEAFGFILLPVGSLTPVLIFLIFIMLLLFKPEGLFGRRNRV
jgi:branched-chain amino acid transport system permease protein